MLLFKPEMPSVPQIDTSGTLTNTCLDMCFKVIRWCFGLWDYMFQTVTDFYDNYKYFIMLAAIFGVITPIMIRTADVSGIGFSSASSDSVKITRRK